MATNKLQWKRIAKGDELPCQSFLRKKDGEILKLSTVGGVKVGQDCYYLPVDEVINVIKDYPVEESEDERIRKELLLDIPKVFPHDKAFRYIAYLEKQGEQKPADWSEKDENLLKLSLENLTELKDRFGEEHGKVGDCIVFLESLKDRYTWKPSKEQIMALRWVLNHIPYNSHKEEINGLLEQLLKLFNYGENR